MKSLRKSSKGLEEKRCEGPSIWACLSKTMLNFRNVANYYSLAPRSIPLLQSNQQLRMILMRCLHVYQASYSKLGVNLDVLFLRKDTELVHGWPW